jgi:hypothetical protein
MQQTVNPLPPQAYTKETLMKALKWLIHQPPHIREMATSDDLTVSLYIKTKLQGENALERPSIQNFKNDLKSLAGMMGGEARPQYQEQEDYAPPVKIPPKSPTLIQSHVEITQPQSQSQSQSINLHQVPVNSASSAQLGTKFDLDAKSLNMIHEVKTGLNLSSESEALRLLISLGYQKSKGLIQS